MNDQVRTGYLLQPGLLDYADAWEMQRELAAARANDVIPDTLVLLEHPHTYTLGRAGRAAHLLMGEGERSARGVDVYAVDRGGDITYHGPGQLVGYPILFLGRPSVDGRISAVDYVGYLREIEHVLISTLALWNIEAYRLEGRTGVWVCNDRPQKIAAIGIKVDGKGISQHGFALNVNPDLSYFDGIVPCGIKDLGVTSMSRLLGRILNLTEVSANVAAQFGAAFNLDWLHVSLDTLPERANVRSAPSAGSA